MTMGAPVRAARLLACAAVLFACFMVLGSCSHTPEPTPVNVVIVPKFEEGAMAGDFPGEAQLFYERYCPGCEEIAIDNMPPTAHLYLNEDNGVAILVTGSGKTPAALSLTALLSDPSYDFSDAYIVSVGCAGGNYEYTTFGDVIVDTAACDYDLGHHVDAHEKTAGDSRIMWFPDDAYADYAFKLFDPGLCERVYDMTKDTPLRTTEAALSAMERNFGDRPEGELKPSVKKGTALSGDNYWKGDYGHETAKYIVEHYGCPDPYAVSEMEEVALANVASDFGMLERVVSLRVVVNMDVFMDGETPESVWGAHDNVNEKYADENTETLDVFEPAMHNLYDVASTAIDAILTGELNS